MTAAAEIVAAVGAQQLAASAPAATLAAAGWVAAVITGAWLLQFPLRWWLRRRDRITHIVILPHGEEIDVPDFVRQPKHARPRTAPRPAEPFLADGVTDAIQQILKEADD